MLYDRVYCSHPPGSGNLGGFVMSSVMNQSYNVIVFYTPLLFLLCMVVFVLLVQMPAVCSSRNGEELFLVHISLLGHVVRQFHQKELPYL